MSKPSCDVPIPSEIPIWYAPEFQPEDLEVRPPHLGNTYQIKACKTSDPAASLILIDEEGRYRANVDIEDDNSPLVQLVLNGSQLSVRCLEVDGYFGTGRLEAGEKGSASSSSTSSASANRRGSGRSGWFSRRKTKSVRRG